MAASIGKSVFCADDCAAQGGLSGIFSAIPQNENWLGKADCIKIVKSFIEILIFS